MISMTTAEFGISLFAAGLVGYVILTLLEEGFRR